MKDKIRELLIGKFGELDTDQEDRVVSKIEKQAKTEEEVKSYIDSLTVKQLLQSYADARVNEAIEKVRGEKETKGVKQEEPKPTAQAKAEDTTKPANNTKEDAPQWAKDIIARIKSLEGAKLKESRTTRLSQVIGSLPTHLQAPYKRIALDTYSDDDFDKLIDEINTEVSGISEKLRAESSVFGRPKATGVQAMSDGEKKATNADVEDTLKYL